MTLAVVSGRLCVPVCSCERVLVKDCFGGTVKQYLGLDAVEASEPKDLSAAQLPLGTIDLLFVLCHLLPFLLPWLQAQPCLLQTWKPLCRYCGDHLEAMFVTLSFDEKMCVWCYTNQLWAFLTITHTMDQIITDYFIMLLSAWNTIEQVLPKSVWKCSLSLTSGETLGKPGLPAYTCSMQFDSAGWRAAYLPPEQLSNSHKKTPEPLLNIERGAAEGLPSPLNDHDLHQKHREWCHYRHKGETDTAPSISTAPTTFYFVKKTKHTRICQQSTNLLCQEKYEIQGLMQPLFRLKKINQYLQSTYTENCI